MSCKLKTLLALSCCLYSLQLVAADFHVSFLNDYKTLVYGSISMPSKQVLEVEITDTIVLNGATDLRKGLKLTLPYYNHQNKLTEEQDAVLALRNDDGQWRVERIFMGEEDDGFRLNFQNRLSSVSITAKEFAQGLKRTFADLIIQPAEHRTINYANNLGEVTLRVSEETFKKDLRDNPFLMHLFKEWDYFQCFTTPLTFGFWLDLERAKARLKASHPRSEAIPMIDQQGKTNLLFTRFLEVDSMSNIMLDYAYFFDPLSYTFRLAYQFTPDSSFKRPESASAVFLSNYGFFPNSALDKHAFGDYYFPDNAMFQMGSTDPLQLVLPVYTTSGVLHFYTEKSDSLVARITSGMFTGEWNYYTSDYYYEMNFNELGQTHGACAIYEQKMGKLLFYEHYTANARNGHHYSTFPSGKVCLEGSYLNNKRIGEWKEHYPPELGGGIKSKNNYTYDQSTYHPFPSNWIHPKILSNRCIDQENIHILDGFQLYFDSDGSKLSIQNWKNGELITREDWYRQPLNSELGVDSLGGLTTVIQDTIYHTRGEYKNNQPWSGSFLVGANNYHLGSASGRGPHIRISIETYAEGKMVNETIVFDNRLGQVFPEDIIRIEDENRKDDSSDTKKKRCFLKRKKYVRTCGGKLLEAPDDQYQKHKGN
jgi:antitoxin component YwqK of YwqJK toxin-antitoxin module